MTPTVVGSLGSSAAAAAMVASARRYPQEANIERAHEEGRRAMSAERWTNVPTCRGEVARGLARHAAASAVGTDTTAHSTAHDHVTQHSRQKRRWGCRVVACWRSCLPRAMCHALHAVDGICLFVCLLRSSFPIRFAHPPGFLDVHFRAAWDVSPSRVSTERPVV